MRKYLVATCVLTLLLTACGKETIIKEVLVTTAPVTTEAPLPQEPAKTKFDLYLEDLYGFSGQARSWTESDLLKFGTIVCDTFDRGNSLEDIIGVMSQYSEGSYDDELFAGVIYAAVTHLCPKHKAYVDSQI